LFPTLSTQNAVIDRLSGVNSHAADFHIFLQGIASKVGILGCYVAVVILVLDAMWASVPLVRQRRGRLQI
jgi:hypothetical protein